jgi:hypothetical protein
MKLKRFNELHENVTDNIEELEQQAIELVGGIREYESTEDIIDKLKDYLNRNRYTRGNAKYDKAKELLNKLEEVVFGHHDEVTNIFSRDGIIISSEDIIKIKKHIQELKDISKGSLGLASIVKDLDTIIKKY